MEEQGWEGYGRWMRLLEVVASKMDGSDRCHAEYPVNKWCEILGFYHRKSLESFLNLTVMYLKCTVNVQPMSGKYKRDVITISIPNLLKKRDEYSKKSGQNPERVRTRVAQEERKKIKINKKTTPLTPHGGDGQWEKFWTAYPKRKSKQDAIKAWNQLEPDDGLLQIMLAAIQTQRETEQWQKESGSFIPFPATWIRGRLWEDETGEIIGEDDNEQKWEDGRYLPSKRMLREQREGR